MKYHEQFLETDGTKSDVVKLPIIELDELAINMISAGEVIERPAAVVKELIENSIDANATSLQITFSHGGKSFIKVTDDGWGIEKSQLDLAIRSHSTSKLKRNDLENIRTLGFRGEALSSISAVSKLVLRSKAKGEKEAAELIATNGKLLEIRPAALQQGTVVEINDLFFSTPARLKFLRSDRVETQAIYDVVKRQALVNPEVGFFLQEVGKNKDKVFLDLLPEKGEDMFLKRIQAILSADFSENSIEIASRREGYSVFGQISLPTNTVSSTANQYFFVNGRPLKDKQLNGALKAAYFDFIGKGRHPSAVIYLWCSLDLIDVNVHPMKSEVRFKSPSDVKSLIVRCVNEAFIQNGLKSNKLLSSRISKSFSLPTEKSIWRIDEPLNSFDKQKNENPIGQKSFSSENSWSSGKIDGNNNRDNEGAENFRLGLAKAQVHLNYILAQTKDGLVIVDQHAAHERITYEKLKLNFINKRTESQSLLLPEIIELPSSEHEVILEAAEKLKEIGFEIENFGDSAICVRGVPALITTSDLKSLINDIIDEILTTGATVSIDNRIDAILSRIACHGSIRLGRSLNAAEMNALLRSIETTPFSAQCNHGRPTFVELKLNDIEKLFGRK